MNAHTINALDTITNLIMLLAIILPIYILGLSHIIGDMPIMAYKPVKVTTNGHMRIITIRNPYNNKWITTITLSHTPIQPEPIRAPIALFANPYRFAMGLLVILLLAACNAPTTAPDSSQPIKVYGKNGACIEAFPVLPDMVVHGLTNGYDYKVSNLENRTNRCFVNPDQEGVVCHSKNRGDTLYFIDQYCPATLKARAELGG